MSARSKSKKPAGEKAPVEPPPIIFDEFSAVAELVDSVIILLQSPEQPVVLKALHHLDKFASKFAGNVGILHEHGLLAAIAPYWESNHRFVRRFAMKLAAALFVLPEAREELWMNDQLFAMALKNYIRVSRVDRYMVLFNILVYIYPCFQYTGCPINQG